MKKIIICCLILFSLMTSYSQTPDNNTVFYYTSRHEKIEISEIPDKAIVQLPKDSSGEANLKTFTSMLNRSGLISTDFIIENLNYHTFLLRGNYQKICELLYSDVQTVYTMYLNKYGEEVGIADEICVKFKPEITDQQKNNLLNSFGLRIKKSYHFGDILIVSEKGKTIEIANKLFETGMFQYSQPSFLGKVKPGGGYIPNDTYFNKQFNMHNTGQVINDGRTGLEDADVDAPEAWQITKGSSDIVIAIIDEGVTANHPDLPASRQIRLPDSDIYSGDDDPSPSGDRGAHGNACAGIAAAEQDNNEGISGIAPRCKIMPIRITTYNDEEAIYECAIAIEFAWMHGADIISCSWGWGWEDDPVESAIYDAVHNGRHVETEPYGCVVSACIGNNARHSKGENAEIWFPARVDIDAVLTVAASDRYDKQADYSPTNALIDVAAPSHRAYYDLEYWPDECQEVWTMDSPDNTGFNTGKFEPYIGEVLPNWGSNYLSYTGRFSGTSAACPMVAGIAALVLSVNPELYSWDCEVLDIIRETADKVGGYDYHDNTWSAELGWGRVNAYKAVKYTLENYGGTIGGVGETVIFNETLTIKNGATLKILPGTTVKFNSAYSTMIVVNSGGKVIAEGTSANPITFEHANGINYWTAFDIKSGGNIFKYCTFKHAGTDLIFSGVSGANTI